MIHGADTWLNYGFPLGSVTVLLSLLLYVFFWFQKVILQCRGGFQIESAEVCENGTFCYLHLKKPKHYKIVEGQYAFLNCPAISFWQWHPFSICSSNKNEHITFLIKNNGDFTSKLITQIQEIQKKHTDGQTLNENLNGDAVPQFDIDNESNGSNHEVQYPGINLSRPISSPAVLSKSRSNVVYIGTGAGIATFLSFIDQQYIQAKSNEDINLDENDNDKGHQVDVVFVSRELEHLKWIAPYIEGILKLPAMTNKMRFHIYMTIKDETNNLASFMFLRALTLFNIKRELVNGKAKTLSLKLGRPDFNRLLDNIIDENDVPERYIYACGPKVMTDSVEKMCLSKTTKQNKLIFNYEIF